MSNLKSLLEYLLERTENGEPFGKSFNDPNKKRPIGDPPEKNTPEEQNFINNLDKWFNSHLVAGSLNNFADELAQLIPIINSGKYPELQPPSGDVYRGMRLTVDQLKSFMGLKDFQIKAGEYKTINQGGVLTPQKIKFYTSGKPISSWSTSAKSAAAFARTNKNDENYKTQLSVLFVANTNNPSNNFILNPDKLSNSYYRTITKYDNEKEVVAIGPVSFDRVIVYSTFDVLPPQTSENDGINTAINNVVNDLTIALKDQKSDIHKWADYLGLIQHKDTKEDPPYPTNRYLSEAIMNILERHLKNIIKKQKVVTMDPWTYVVLNVMNEEYMEGTTPFANRENIKRFIDRVIRNLVPSGNPYSVDTGELEKLATTKQEQK